MYKYSTNILSTKICIIQHKVKCPLSKNITQCEFFFGKQRWYFTYTCHNMQLSKVVVTLCRCNFLDNIFTKLTQKWKIQSFSFLLHELADNDAARMCIGFTACHHCGKEASHIIQIVMTKVRILIRRKTLAL